MGIVLVIGAILYALVCVVLSAGALVARVVDWYQHADRKAIGLCVLGWTMFAVSAAMLLVVKAGIPGTGWGEWASAAMVWGMSWPSVPFALGVVLLADALKRWSAGSRSEVMSS